MPRFTAPQLHAVATTIIRAAGADEATTAIVVDHLIDANLTGYDSHGVLQIPVYVRSIQRGQTVPTARPEIVRETAAMTLIDAHQSFGQVSAQFATDEVVAKARAHGVAIAGTFRGNHVGRLGYYAARAAAQGVALLVTLGSLGRPAAPFGGRTAALGTNPLAFGFPVEAGTPFLLDFATTGMATGRVMMARDQHDRLPPNMLIDGDGRPTTDPAALFAGGSLLPFGGHKGYALSLMAVLLSNALIRTGQNGDGPDDGAKVFFCAIDTHVFGDGAPAAAAAVFDRVRAVPPAEGTERVVIPGERSEQTARRRRTEGIEVADDTWKKLAAAASEVGVSV